MRMCVLDLEFNAPKFRDPIPALTFQSIDAEHNTVAGVDIDISPQGTSKLKTESLYSVGKTIQIGAVCLDGKTGTVVSMYRSYVNPYETLDPRIIELTGITQNNVDESQGLETVLREFWAWTKESGCSKTMVVWGSDDKWIRADSAKCGIEVPRFKVIDLKAVSVLLRNALPTGKQTGGLGATLDAFGVPFRGRPHDALNDAVATADLAYKFITMIRGFLQVESIMNNGEK